MSLGNLHRSRWSPVQALLTTIVETQAAVSAFAAIPDLATGAAQFPGSTLSEPSRNPRQLIGGHLRRGRFTYETIDRYYLIAGRPKPFIAAARNLAASYPQNRMDCTFKRAAVIGLDLDIKNGLIRGTCTDLVSNSLHGVAGGIADLQPIRAANVPIRVND
jgi:hypothetical protein